MPLADFLTVIMRPSYKWQLPLSVLQDLFYRVLIGYISLLAHTSIFFIYRKPVNTRQDSTIFHDVRYLSHEVLEDVYVSLEKFFIRPFLVPRKIAKSRVVRPSASGKHRPRNVIKTISAHNGTKRVCKHIGAIPLALLRVNLHF